jgi:hypothetical protein
MSRFANVEVPEPWFLYLAVKVLLPGVNPVITLVALARTRLLHATASARVSEAATVVAPLTAYDMRASAPPTLPKAPAVTITSAFPEAGIVTVTEGPGVVRSA